MTESKRAKLWRHVKKNGSITTWEGIECAAYTRTSAWIAYLESKGIEVDHVTKKNKCGDKYTRYYISGKEIRRAEKEGLVNYEQPT